MHLIKQNCLYTENLSKNYNLDDPGIALPVFPPRPNLKLHNISVWLSNMLAQVQSVLD